LRLVLAATKERAFLPCVKPAAAPPAGKLPVAGDLPSLAKFALEHGLTPPE